MPWEVARRAAAAQLARRSPAAHRIATFTSRGPSLVATSHTTLPKPRGRRSGSAVGSTPGSTARSASRTVSGVATSCRAIARACRTSTSSVHRTGTDPLLVYAPFGWHARSLAGGVLERAFGALGRPQRAWLGVAAPEPAEGVGEDRAGVVRVVRTVADHQP